MELKDVCVTRARNYWRINKIFRSYLTDLLGTKISLQLIKSTQRRSRQAIDESMSEAQSNPPALGGYDDEFVNAVEEDWRCVICQLPLKQPIQTKCGHSFCTQCLNGHFERYKSIP